MIAPLPHPSQRGQAVERGVRRYQHKAQHQRRCRNHPVERIAVRPIEQARLNGFSERRVVWRYGLRSALAPTSASRLDRLLALVDQGIASIRQVTSDLRPSLLDDLGLVPALRSLVADFADRSGLRVTLTAPDTIPPLLADSDLALFRALQEALSNVAQHAGGTAVQVALTIDDGWLSVITRDNGQGFAVGRDGKVRATDGRMGLTGMRERLHAFGGTVELRNVDGGAEVALRLLAHAGVRRRTDASASPSPEAWLHEHLQEGSRSRERLGARAFRQRSDRR